MAVEYDHLFKLVLVGDSGVGKSSLLLRFADDVFDEHLQSTIGVDFKLKIMRVGSKICKVTIWDTAGQERFRTLTSSYYRRAHGIVIVFDVTRPESFASLEAWLKEIKAYASKGVVMLLVGNKIDMETDRAVSTKTATDWARAHGMLYIESSAKNAENVRTVFEEVVLKILDSPTLMANTAPAAPKASVSLGAELKPDAKEGGSGGSCC